MFSIITLFSFYTNIITIRTPKNSFLNLNIHQGVDSIADEVIGFDKSFTQQFLSNYWQKKPLMIRNAIKEVGDNSLVTGDDLLDLSVEDDVESRMIFKTITTTTNQEKWRKRNGPFEIDEVNIHKLPKKDWTILVQEVDRHIPKVADLWENYFNFRLRL